MTSRGYKFLLLFLVVGWCVMMWMIHRLIQSLDLKLLAAAVACTPWMCLSMFIGTRELEARCRERGEEGKSRPLYLFVREWCRIVMGAVFFIVLILSPRLRIVEWISTILLGPWLIIVGTLEFWVLPAFEKRCKIKFKKP